MTPVRKSLDGRAVILMLMLCLCWGLQQVAIKVAAPNMATILQTGIRSLVGAVLVGVLMLWRGTDWRQRDGTLLPGLAAGALFAAEFLCIAIGLTLTSASHMVVFLYTAPIFTVLGLHWTVAGERLRAPQWAGIGLAFAGMALAFFSGFDGSGTARTLLGDACALLAGLLWAATTLVIRGSALSEAAPTKTLLYQLGVSALLLLPLAASLGQFATVAMNAMAWYSLLFQAVIVTFASYLTWFWILRKYLASRVSVFSFLTPLFGVGFGVLLLHETVGLRFACGAALVLAGILMVNLR